jgi:hypothetical protein
MALRREELGPIPPAHGGGGGEAGGSPPSASPSRMPMEGGDSGPLPLLPPSRLGRGGMAAAAAAAAAGGYGSRAGLGRHTRSMSGVSEASVNDVAARDGTRGGGGRGRASEAGVPAAAPVAAVRRAEMVWWLPRAHGRGTGLLPAHRNACTLGMGLPAASRSHTRPAPLRPASQASLLAARSRGGAPFATVSAAAGAHGAAPPPAAPMHSRSPSAASITGQGGAGAGGGGAPPSSAAAAGPSEILSTGGLGLWGGSQVRTGRATLHCNARRMQWGPRAAASAVCYAPPHSPSAVEATARGPSS